MQLKIKKLSTPEELLAHDMTAAVGFVTSLDPDEQLQKHMQNAEKPRRDDCWGAMDENGDIFASMENNIYNMEFDGHIVAAGGVGGVSSLPEYRGQGGIREIFREQFREMYRKGFLLSALYPFSYSFYRPFGYELCAVQTQHTIEIQALRAFSCTMDVYMCRKDDPLDDFKTVHEEFIKGKNLAIHRRDDQWQRADSDPFKDRIYKYMFCDPQGLPRAYVIFRPEAIDGKRAAAVLDIAWLAPDDLLQIFGFLYRLRAQYSFVRVSLPAEVPLHALLPEWEYGRTELKPHVQMRIICVQKALELLHYPDETGQFVLQISDPFLPENAGIYAVTFAEEKAVMVEKSGAEPDLSLSIQRFSQLACGFIDLAQAVYLSDVSLHGNRDTLEKVFVKKPVFLSDSF